VDSLNQSIINTLTIGTTLTSQETYTAIEKTYGVLAAENTRKYYMYELLKLQNIKTQLDSVKTDDEFKQLAAEAERIMRNLSPDINSVSQHASHKMLMGPLAPNSNQLINQLVV
jgi:hypothetical protein